MKKIVLLVLAFLYILQSALAHIDCNNADTRLQISPDEVFVVGGEDILVEGPCFQNTDSVELIYDANLKVKCGVVDASRALCKVPLLDRVGQITIQMKINQERTFNGKLLVKTFPSKPANGLLEVYTENELRPVTIEWKFESFEGEEYVVYYIPSDPNTEPLLLNANLKPGNNIINLALILPHLKANMPLGFIAAGSRSRVNSMLKIQWFSVSPLYTFIVGTLSCKLWHSIEPDRKALVNSLPPCWRILPIRPDGSFPEEFGDFVADSSCNPNNKAACKFFHKGAKGCFRSATPIDGAGQQCCYDSNNNLLVGPPGYFLFLYFLA